MSKSSDDGLDGFSKALFENLLKQTNEQSDQLDQIFTMLDAVIAYLREKDPEFVEFATSHGEVDFEMDLDEDDENGDVEDISEHSIVIDSVEDSLERSIPFNVAHIEGDTAGGFFNPVRGCMCTPFDCPFKSQDCQIVQIIKQQQEKKDSDEGEHISP